MKKSKKEIMIKCSVCKRKHFQSLSNCCWITCDCGNEICGKCGSTNLGEIPEEDKDDESGYWCCRMCEDCGLTGCAMHI